MARHRRPTVRTAARRRSKELHRQEEVERRARQQLPKRRIKASDRRAVQTELRRRLFGL